MHRAQRLVIAVSLSCNYLTVELLNRQVVRDFKLPSITVRQQLGLVVQQLLVGLRRKLKVGAFDNSINWTGFLAETTVDALGHINVVARRTTAAVCTRFLLTAHKYIQHPVSKIRAKVERTASIVMAWAGQMASHNLQAMHLQKTTRRLHQILPKMQRYAVKRTALRRSGNDAMRAHHGNVGSAIPSQTGS